MKSIYKITNKINGKVYIGQSKNPDRRWKEHCTKHTVYKSMIGEAIQKYGADNFCFEVLGWFDDYNEKEKEFIIEYNSLAPNGYNIAIGGENPPVMLGEDNPFCKITEEIAKEIQQDLIDFKLEKREIADKYGVTMDIIRHINDGDSWKDESLNYPLRPLDKEMKRDKIDAIIDALINTTKTQKQIAEEFGMARTAITAINNGKNWYDPNIDYPIRKTNRQKKPILQINIETNEVIHEYASIAEAAKAFGKTSNVMFSRALNGTNKTAYGFIWKYKE